MADNFWLNDAQWALIEPHLPKVHTGPVRKDDRRVISGILHRLREGCRWRALPDEYGPYTTVFNRFNRWSKRGIWQRFSARIRTAGAHVDRQLRRRAHRSASGAKGGKRAKPLAARAADARQKSMRSSTKKAGRMRSF